MVQPSSNPEPETADGFEIVVERGPGQSVMIGDDIEIILLDAGPDSARLGVIAPDGVHIAHGELRRR